MGETIKQILIRRDKMSEAGAKDLVAEAKRAFDDYLLHDDIDAAYDICEEYFGLEPDYLMEFM